jgi:hypothetical protein
MTTVRYKIRRGPPNLVGAKLRADVKIYTADHSIFKIGRTSNPEARAKHNDYADTYKEMVVVYETKSAQHADAVERHLVSSFQSSRNFRGGGGGPHGRPPYYVYLVRQKSFWQGLLSIFQSAQSHEEAG